MRRLAGVAVALAAVSAVAAPALQVVVPPVPDGPVVLRVSVTPAVPSDRAVLLRPSLQVQGEPATAVTLAPWSLHPPDQPSRFVLRVPPALMAAARRGGRLVLTVTAVPLHAPASGSAPARDGAAGIALQADWETLREN